MGSQDIQPDVDTYEALAKSFALHGLHLEALRLIDDARAVGVEPDVGVWNQVLRAHVLADVSPTPVLRAMLEASVTPNAVTKQLIVQQHVNKRNLDEALKVLYTPTDVASSLGSPVSPPNSSPPAASTKVFTDVSLQTIVAVAGLASTQGETALAADLIKAFEK